MSLFTPAKMKELGFRPFSEMPKIDMERTAKRIDRVRFVDTRPEEKSLLIKAMEFAQKSEDSAQPKCGRISK